MAEFVAVVWPLDSSLDELDMDTEDVVLYDLFFVRRMNDFVWQ